MLHSIDVAQYITPQHIEKYKSAQIKKGLNRKSINNQLNMLNKCLKTAEEWEMLERAPKIKWLKTTPSKTDFLSQEECMRLLSCAEDEWYEMILIALMTGIRQSELKALMWESINWDNRVLEIRYSWCDYKKTLGSPKSNRVRYIPLNDRIYELLFNKKRKSGFLYVDETKKPINGKRLDRRLKSICKKAGLRKISWHVLRHTFASQLVMSGASLRAVQELLGHAEITTTMRYSHLTPSALKDTVALLDHKRINFDPFMNFGQPAGNHEKTLIKKNP